MVAHSASSANRDLSWPALTGKRELRGSTGIGLSVACWISETLEFAVVPMWPIAKMEGRKVPLEKWKELDYRTPLEIRRDSKFRMKCGVAVLAGKSGLVVIDIDSESSWDEFVGMQDMPRTMELSTHSGRQLIFRDDTGITFKTQGGQLARGVDVRGRGGLFVVYDPGQPERHFTDLTSPAELPGWLRAAIPLAGTRGHRKGNAPPRKKVDVEAIVRGIPPGQHHDRLNALALALVNRGGISDQAWYDLATSVLANSREGTDGKGNARDPFSDAEIMDFLHTAQAKRREEIAAERAEPGQKYRDAQLTRSFDSVTEEDVIWLWERYLACGFLTQLDGEKGQAKTFIIADVIARATTGRAMPGEEESICDPIDVFYFAEDVPAQVRKRLRAAGADLSRVHLPDPDYVDAIIRAKGATEALADEEDLRLLLPDGAGVMLEMIRQSGAALVIWDPIMDYLQEDIQTGIDASVRRALDPIARGLEQLGVAGLSVRHMNKDPKAAARHRGGGSTAFQNRARVHLVTGRLAEEYSECGTFGLAMVDNNFTRRVDGTLAFDVVDSDIKLDNRGNMIGKIEWHDLEEDITTDTLTRGSDGEGNGKGPRPDKRNMIIHILDEMGKQKRKWDAAEAKQHILEKLSEMGIDGANPATINNARKASWITTQSRKGDVGKNDWVWPVNRVPRQRNDA